MRVIRLMCALRVADMLRLPEFRKSAGNSNYATGMPRTTLHTVKKIGSILRGQTALRIDLDLGQNVGSFHLPGKCRPLGELARRRDQRRRRLVLNGPTAELKVEPPQRRLRSGVEVGLGGAEGLLELGVRGVGVPAAGPDHGAEDVDARDPDADLREEPGIREEALEAAVVVQQPERGRVQAQLQQEFDGGAEGLPPRLGRVSNVGLAL